MTMREKIARNLYLKHQEIDDEVKTLALPWDHPEGDDTREIYLALADAALDPLMEPTEGMLDGGNCAEWYGGMQGHVKAEREEVKKVIQGAITAAKEGK